MSTTGAAFSVRFLRNGDQVVIVRNIVNRKNSGLALFQVIDPMAGTIAPNWDATNLPEGAEKEAVLDAQPIIQLGVRSSYGYTAEIKSVKWAYDGTDLQFTLSGEVWVTAANDAKFQARIVDKNYQLKIVGNLASAEKVANKQITYDVNYACNGMTDTVQGSVDVLIQAAGSDSHMLQIKTNRVELDAENPDALLEAVCMYGTKNVTIGSNGYAIKWYKDGDEISNATGLTLTVGRGDVTGGSLFIAKLFLNGNAVAQDSQRINDIADEYQIQAIPTAAGENWLGIGHNATYNLSVICNKEPYAGSVKYEWTVYNAIGEPQLPNPGSRVTGTGSLVTVLTEYAKVVTGEKAYYADCDVQVTAEF